MSTDAEKKDGYLVQVTSEAFKRSGYDLEVRYLPWKRALEESMTGKVDGLLGAYYTDERAEKLYYSEPVGEVVISFMALKESNIRYNTLTDLKALEIGMVRGAVVNADFDQADYLNKIPVSTIEQNIQKLINNRVALIVDKQQQLQNIVENQYPDWVDKVEYLSPPLRVDYFYNAFFMAHPDGQKILTDFNKGLAEIRADGTYDQILQKYKLP
ncbi:transporter substrate-binding domain-containing protein [Gynuella sunshinyii]|nr:transporter substrate-binding domain-containing protein [Gynuella sunshinyii]